MKSTMFRVCTLPACIILLATAALTQVAGAREEQYPARSYSVTEERAPCSHYDPLRQPFFGDTHVHTAWSFNANSQGTRNKPEDAYRFAMGERLGIQPYDDDRPTRQVQIDRPLDFTAVTDHSEFMGEMRMSTTSGETGYWHPVCIAHRWFPQFSYGTFAAYGLSGKI